MRIDQSRGCARSLKFLIAFIFLSGLVYRGWFIFFSDLLFNADSAVFALMGKHILQGKTFPVLYYSQSYNGAAPTYLIALLYKIFGIALFAFRLHIFILSMAVYTVMTLMYRSVLSKKLFMPAFVVLTALPMSLIIPTQGMYQLSLLTAVIFFWLTAKWVKTQKNSFFYIGAVVVGFSWYSQPASAGAVLFVFLVYIMEEILAKQKQSFVRHVEIFLLWGLCFFAGSSLYWLSKGENADRFNPIENFYPDLMQMAIGFFKFGWRNLLIVSGYDTIPSFLKELFVVFFCAVCVFLIIRFIWLFRYLRNPEYKTEFLFYLLGLSTVVIFSLDSGNDYTTYRHLFLLSISLPVLTSVFMANLPRRLLLINYLLVGLIYTGAVTASLSFNSASIKKSDDLLRYLKSRNYTYGFASYWNSYNNVFLSDETILISPLWGSDRYESYTKSIIAGADAFYLFDQSLSDEKNRYELFKEMLTKIENVSFTEEEYLSYKIISKLSISNSNGRHPIKYFNPVYEDVYWRPKQTPDGKKETFKRYYLRLALPPDVYNFELRVKYNGEYKDNVYNDDGYIAIIDPVTLSPYGKVECEIEGYKANPQQVYRFKAYANPSRYIKIIVHFPDANLELESMLIY